MKGALMKPQNTHKYDDIIDMEYPLKTSDTVKHPRMSNAERAKIFAPFAALRGFDDVIDESEVKFSDTLSDEIYR
jgi:hypothetical protein